jgi:hypothetical protein
LLKKFYVNNGHPEGAADVFLKESWGYARNSRVAPGTPLPLQRVKLIDQAAELYSQTKEHTFEAKSAEEHIKLLKVQHDLEVDTSLTIFVDSSLSDTITTCIVMGNLRFSKDSHEFQERFARDPGISPCPRQNKADSTFPHILGFPTLKHL